MKSPSGVRILSFILIGSICLFSQLTVQAQTVPPQYQAIYNNMSSQISAFQTLINQNWNGTPYPVAWAPQLSSATSNQYLALLNPTYYQTVLVELQELQATGAQAVTVHINFPILYQPFYTYAGNTADYQQFVTFYQQLASDIHARGMKLVVEAITAEALDGTEGGDFETYYQTLDWNAYMNGRAQNAVNIAQLIQPDYLSLICEPDTEAADAYQPTENSPTGALQLLQTILAAFQQANVTNVTIGAGAGTWIADFTSYIQNFSATSLNYIDMHVYPVNNDFLTNILTGVSIAQQAGKGVATSEAWPNKIANSELKNPPNFNVIAARDVFSFWAPIDTAFLRSMVDVAQYQKFLFFSPFYTQYFAAYLNYNTYGTETPAQLLPAAIAAGTSANNIGAFTSTGQAFSVMIAGEDTTPPATPDAPTSTSVSGTGVTLNWTLTTDNVGVAGYNIYRNGTVVSQLALPPFRDTNLTPGATYIYNLSAFDAQGNVSSESPPLSVTTIDTTPPSTPTNFMTTGITLNTISLSWSPSTGNGGVSGYHVLKGNSPSTLSIIGSVTGTSYVSQYLSPSNTYYYAVEAYNPIGIESPPSPTIGATTLALLPPANLVATSVSASTVDLSWSPVAGAPLGYRILKGKTPTSLTTIVGNNPSTTYVDSAVAPKTTYYYEVETLDSLGDLSGPSTMLTVTTPAL
jgi:chitodextrinase